MTAAFAGRSVWIFDVDYTLYAPEAALFEQVASRITAFVSSALDLPLDQARAKQREYYLTYGTTLAGMVRHHGIDPRLFSSFVHDIDYGVLTPNRSLKHKIAALPGRKLIFTNATLAHVDKVLGGLDLSFDDFDGAFDVEMADWTPKPHPLPYKRLMERFQVAPARGGVLRRYGAEPGDGEGARLVNGLGQVRPGCAAGGLDLFRRLNRSET